MSQENVSPTRINLIQTRKTLSLANSGRAILERKRDILLRELRNSVYDAERAREDLLDVLEKAYLSLRKANMAKGSQMVENAAISSSVKANFLLDYRIIMGVTVPIVEFQVESDVKPDYGFASTTADLDEAFNLFYRVLDLLAELARTEGTAFQIANDVRRTQRRVNALNHVLIPSYGQIVKRIERVLEEKEREEFVRTKRTKELILKRE